MGGCGRREKQRYRLEKTNGLGATGATSLFMRMMPNRIWRDAVQRSRWMAGVTRSMAASEGMLVLGACLAARPPAPPRLARCWVRDLRRKRDSRGALVGGGRFWRGAGG